MHAVRVAKTTPAEFHHMKIVIINIVVVAVIPGFQLGPSVLAKTMH